MEGWHGLIMLDPLGGLRTVVVAPDKLLRREDEMGVPLGEELLLFTADPRKAQQRKTSACGSSKCCLDECPTNYQEFLGPFGAMKCK